MTDPSRSKNTWRWTGRIAIGALTAVIVLANCKADLISLEIFREIRIVTSDPPVGSELGWAFVVPGVWFVAESLLLALTAAWALLIRRRLRIWGAVLLILVNLPGTILAAVAAVMAHQWLQSRWT
jgi:hypothetical protein